MGADSDPHRPPGTRCPSTWTSLSPVTWFSTRPATDLWVVRGGTATSVRLADSGVAAEERGSRRIGHHRREAGTHQRPRILCGDADAETPAARARVARLVGASNGVVQAAENGAAVEGRRGSGGGWRRDGSGGRGRASESGDALGRVGCFVLLPPLSHSHRRKSHQTIRCLFCLVCHFP